MQFISCKYIEEGTDTNHRLKGEFVKSSYIVHKLNGDRVNG